MLIEKNIPLTKRNHASHSTVYGLDKTLNSLSIGDSFILPEGKQKISVYVLSKRLGIKICMRKIDTGFRVWRLE